MHKLKAPENPVVLLQKEIRAKIIKNHTHDYQKIFDFYKQRNEELLRIMRD